MNLNIIEILGQFGVAHRGIFYFSRSTSINLFDIKTEKFDITNTPVTSLDSWIESQGSRIDHNILVIEENGSEFEILLDAFETLKQVDAINIHVRRDGPANKTSITEIDIFLRYAGFRRIAVDWSMGNFGSALYVKENFIKAAGFSVQSVLLADTRFAHTPKELGYDSASLIPTSRFDWSRDLSSLNANSTLIVTDDLIKNFAGVNCDKVAWLIEPAAIDRQSYLDAFEKQDSYKVVVTHDKEFVKAVKNGVHSPFGGTWIKPTDWRAFKKDKLISIIASNKKITRGHQLRHVAAKLIPEDHRFGSAFKEIDNKIEALRDYKFSITIENEIISGYFTEKIVDCLITGTVPIYWGSESISEFFDDRGIIRFETLEELQVIVENENALKQFYEDHLEIIMSNSKKARRYASVDENFLNSLVGVN